MDALRLINPISNFLLNRSTSAEIAAIAAL
jgi:hypothetical protein